MEEMRSERHRMIKILDCIHLDLTEIWKYTAIAIMFLKKFLSLFSPFQIVDCIKGFLNITSDLATFVQGALPQILEKARGDFFSKIVNLLREVVDVCYNRLKEIPCITCPSKPEGSMFVMAKLNLSILEDIKDDVDFCIKLATEESVVVLPGVAVGMKNWLRVTFAVEPSSLEDGLGRIKAFCPRHAKKQYDDVFWYPLQ
ncbi:Nicotianamine aminotransferase 1 [Camellia lanceoleosa]|uniref:Nicotianamine aminotransferase 1 n=1 Tax=Camellia lanceoleosa TaxID=1840588 RepID=A0ACC0IEM4_9ERIC|nr:Nicotianamine aminotransferase 1 [Camellia lanceoleosa]